MTIELSTDNQGMNEYAVRGSDNTRLSVVGYSETTPEFYIRMGDRNTPGARYVYSAFTDEQMRDFFRAYLMVRQEYVESGKLSADLQ